MIDVGVRLLARVSAVALAAVFVGGCSGGERAACSPVPQALIDRAERVASARPPRPSASVATSAVPTCADWPYPAPLRAEVANRGRRFLAGLYAGVPTEALRREVSPQGIELIDKRVEGDGIAFDTRHLDRADFDTFVRDGVYTSKLTGLRGFDHRTATVITRWRVPWGDGLLPCTVYEESLPWAEVGNHFDGTISVIIEHDKLDLDLGNHDSSLPIVVFRADAAGELHVTALYTTELAI